MRPHQSRMTLGEVLDGSPETMRQAGVPGSAQNGWAPSTLHSMQRPHLQLEPWGPQGSPLPPSHCGLEAGTQAPTPKVTG